MAQRQVWGELHNAQGHMRLLGSFENYTIASDSKSAFTSYRIEEKLINRRQEVVPTLQLFLSGTFSCHLEYRRPEDTRILFLQRQASV